MYTLRVVSWKRYKAPPFRRGECCEISYETSFRRCICMKKFFALMLLVGALFAWSAPAFAVGSLCPVCNEYAAHYDNETGGYYCFNCHWRF